MTKRKSEKERAGEHPWWYVSNSELVYILMSFRTGGQEAAEREMRGVKLYETQFQPILTMCEHVRDNVGYAEVFCVGLDNWMPKYLQSIEK